MLADCPANAELAAWSLGQLAEVRAQEIASHVAECAECLSSLESLEALDDPVLSDLRRPEVGESFYDEPECRLAVQEIQALVLTSLSTRNRVAEGLTEAEAAAERPRGSHHGRLGPYEILDELGRGGMGAVYRARHVLLRRDVALKVLPADRLGDRQWVSRFRREVESAGVLDHPHIVRAHDAGEVNGTHYLAMELIDGLDLNALVRQRGPLSVADACELIRQVAEGLDHAWRRGLVHRDIKPSNIMLQRDGRAKLLDLGLALLHGGSGADGELTLTGQILGTPDYMAPEQASDTHQVDTRTDLYSLGCTLYFLLAGHAPFYRPGKRNVWKTVTAHAEEPVPPIQGHRPDVSEALAAVLDRLLAKAPDDRFTSPAELAAALEPYCAGSRLAECLDESGDSTSVQDRPESQDRAFQARPRPLPQARNTRIRRRALGVALVAALGAAFLGVIIYVKTDKGRWKIEVPDSEARFDARVIGNDGKTVLSVTHEPHSPRSPARPQPPQSTAGGATTGAPQQTSTRAPAGLKSITNSIGMRLVLIPAGDFLMGSRDDDKLAEERERPQHRVQISHPFYLGATEVTQNQYRLVTGKIPNRDGVGDELPVADVSWVDAVRFCNALSEEEGIVPFYQIKEDLEPADASAPPTRELNEALANRVIESVTVPDWKAPGYRLPTEAEWEYACRAESTTSYCCGDDKARLSEYAWIADNSGQVPWDSDAVWDERGHNFDGFMYESRTLQCRPHPVRMKRPNAFGLYDMHGNVNEWCWDRNGANYYAESPRVDPLGTTWERPTRIARGGSAYLYARAARSATRHANYPQFTASRLGFRIARGQGSPTVAEIDAKPTTPPDAVASPAPDQDAAKTITSAINMRLVLIPAGEFSMGTADGPLVHRVRITRPFYLGTTEVTRGQYRALADPSPGVYKDSDDLPVESVRWLEAARFCNLLSEKDGLTPFYHFEGDEVSVPDWKGSGYRLPTEAEWEYACRAGSETDYCFGNAQDLLSEYGWTATNSGRDRFEPGRAWNESRGSKKVYFDMVTANDCRPHPVGRKKPNAFHLFDMHGNVGEWCWDWYDPLYYRRSPSADPKGPGKTKTRVFRGGTWMNDDGRARSAWRSDLGVYSRASYVGFRVARGLSHLRASTPGHSTPPH